MLIKSTATNSIKMQSASINQVDKNNLYLLGCWTAQKSSDVEEQIKKLERSDNIKIDVDCKDIEALDTVGALLIIKLMQSGKPVHSGEHSKADFQLNNLTEDHQKLIDVLSDHQLKTNERKNQTSALKVKDNLFEQVGKKSTAAFNNFTNVLIFTGETAVAFAKSVKQPRRFRIRPILFNIRTAGFDALPIVGLLSFLLGIVVAYQGADQLRQYGANIFVVDLVGLSMLREFAPLITAIIIAGRSGSAYAAQIGTMAVTEEIDALMTLGISPQELLVLPKVIALIIVLPLLTMFADILGVFGGMIMASQQLGVGFVEFLDRFAKAVSPTAFMIGIGKAPVFAAIIAMVGCYQGFKTKGGADSVGRQTTRSVVQSIFLVIVADAIFSVAFSALDL